MFKNISSLDGEACADFTYKETVQTITASYKLHSEVFKHFLILASAYGRVTLRRSETTQRPGRPSEWRQTARITRLTADESNGASHDKLKCVYGGVTCRTG